MPPGLSVLDCVPTKLVRELRAAQADSHVAVMMLTGTLICWCGRVSWCAPQRRECPTELVALLFDPPHILDGQWPMTGRMPAGLGVCQLPSRRPYVGVVRSMLITSVSPSR
jgi:hypothetical protein